MNDMFVVLSDVWLDNDEVNYIIHSIYFSKYYYMNRFLLIDLFNFLFSKDYGEFGKSVGWL